MLSKYLSFWLARDLLWEAANKVRQMGAKIILRNLTGTYSEIYKFSNPKDDLGLDLGGNPGEVVACLRVYAKIDHQEILGRVLYHF